MTPAGLLILALCQMPTNSMPPIFDTLDDKDLLIVDTDAGVDDALALLLALFPKFAGKFQIMGITCVGGGNTKLDNVYSNVLRVLKVANATEIPVYKGCLKGILGNQTAVESVFGNDGFGGIASTIKVDTSQVIQQHAVAWMYDTVTAYPGRVSLVALGPLTNVAQAQILFSDFSSKLKRLHLMGGSIDAEGSVTPVGEFNVFCDPEAANVVFNKFDCPISVLTREVYLQHALSWDWYRRVIVGGRSSVAKFISKLYALTFSRYLKGLGFASADLSAMAVFLRPDLVSKRKSYAANIETGGTLARGLMVVDRLNLWNKSSKADFIVEYDTSEFAYLMEDLLSTFSVNYY